MSVPLPTVLLRYSISCVVYVQCHGQKKKGFQLWSGGQPRHIYRCDTQDEKNHHFLLGTPIGTKWSSSIWIQNRGNGLQKHWIFSLSSNYKTMHVSLYLASVCFWKQSLGGDLVGRLEKTSLFMGVWSALLTPLHMTAIGADTLQATRGPLNCGLLPRAPCHIN